MKIDDLQLKIILDSRQEKTLEVQMASGNYYVKSSAPQGKSRGEKEASFISAEEALEKFQNIKSGFLKKEFSSLKEFDNFLIKLDGTPNKSNLGGNLILVLSMAFCRLQAKEEKKELYQFLREELTRNFPLLDSVLTDYQPPYFFFNVINGGKHSPFGPNFQEYLIVPQTHNPEESLNLAKIYFAGLKSWFLKNNYPLSYGDEGGLVFPEKDDEKPLAILKEVRKDLSLDDKIKFSLDVAASTFLKKGDNSPVDFYLKIIDNYQLLSLEDPFNEDDLENFKKLKFLIKNQCFIIGDDLTVTDANLIEKAITHQAIDGVIIKPSQKGTITETLEAIGLSLKNNLKIIVSHRSGETMDDFIADLSVAANAWGLKSGNITQKEREIKYQRVKEINDSASR